MLDMFCETTSCHGVSHMHETTSWTSFALWTVLLGFSVAAVVQQLSGRCFFSVLPASPSLLKQLASGVIKESPSNDLWSE